MLPLRWLLVLFFASGICGLVYEVVWMRVLSLTLSVTVYAVTTVLCAFMAGLALGAAVAGRVADRLERPLLGFGLLEIGIGVTGLFAPALLFSLGPLYVWLHEHLGGTGIAFSAGRFLLVAAVLLVPCTLMGASLPLLSRAAIDREQIIGKGAGGLYAVNALGAVIGCIAAGYYLIPELGLRATSAVAALINLAVGLAAVQAGRRRRSAAAGAVPDEAAVPGPVWLIGIAFAVSGFSALGYEVLWSRALQQFTHNSTYAYTAMLAMFLLGIGAGSALAALIADRVRRPLAVFGLLEIGVGVSCVLALLLYMQLLHLVPAGVAAAGGLGSWWRALALIFCVAGATLLPTTFLFGATFPFVARCVVGPLHTVGRRIALAYTLNTLGSIAGAVLVGFVLLPLLGMRSSFVLLILCNLALGALLVTVSLPRRAAAWSIAVATGVAVAAFALLPPQLFRQTFAARYGKLLMYREQVTDTVMVTENARGARLIRYADGRGTAGTVTLAEDRSYAHLAMLAHPDPRRILNICFGVGHSLSTVAQYPIEHAQCVELSPGVVHAAPFFPGNRGVLQDPRVELSIEDGRNFLLTSPERYDIIRLDPPELHTAGIVNLYTREFFELARDHLAPGGVFSIWINIIYTPEADLKAVIRTATEVFPHLTIWHGPFLYSWVINGSIEPRGPDMQILKPAFEDPRLRADLASAGFSDPFALLAHFVMAEQDARIYAQGAEPITDDRTRLDFTVPRSPESYFGISNMNTDNWLVNQIPASLIPPEKALRMCRHKRPVLPHLAHVEASGLSVEAVRSRIDQAQRASPACAAMMHAGDGIR